MRASRRKFFAGLCLLLLLQTGCAAFRPVQGIPARYLSAEMKEGERSARRTINPSLLGQASPPAHLIDAGDVLAIYVEGFIGKASDPPPVHFPMNNETAPSFGLPYPVREDGTISLPAVGSVNLRGLTLIQAEERVRQAYLQPRQLIRPDFHRVQVNLQRPRHYRVLVIRQDSRSEPQSNGSTGQINIGMAKRGTGKVVNLPAYCNDVLNALTASDGLPGLDAENAVYIIRRRGNFQGGTLDPRWPTDLNPALLMQPGAAKDVPIIRGQSPESDSGYLHSQNVVRALYVGSERRDVQQISTQPTPGRNGYYPPNPSMNSNTPLEPSRIWQDRPVNAQVAFEPNPVGLQPGVSAGPSPLGHTLPQQTYGTIPSPAVPYGTHTVPPLSGVAPNSQSPGGPQHFRPADRDLYGSGVGPTPIDPGYGQPQPQYGNQQYVPPGSKTHSPVLDGSAIPPAGNGPTGGGLPYGMSPHSIPVGNLPFGTGVERGIPTDGGQFDPGHSLAGGDTLDGRKVIRIPIQLGPGETADIRPEDVVLYDGDIVFIESRDTEVFYTAGLLGGGQFTLPRDYDLSILEALSLAQSRGTGGARSVGGVSALNNDVSISPSTAIVLRKLPDGSEIPIKIDLYRARTDLAERIVIQPGDYILLQYTPLEAVAAFFERHLLETALFGVAAQNFNSNRN